MPDSSDKKNKGSWAPAHTPNSIPASWDETVNGVSERLEVLKENLPLAYAGTDKCLAIREANKKFNRLFATYPSRFMNKHLAKIIKSPQFTSFAESLLKSPKTTKSKLSTFPLWPAAKEQQPGAGGSLEHREISFFHTRLGTGGFLFFFQDNTPEKTSEDMLQQICAVIQAELRKFTDPADKLLDVQQERITLDEDTSRSMRSSFLKLQRMEHNLAVFSRLSRDYTCYNAPFYLDQTLGKALERLRNALCSEDASLQAAAPAAGQSAPALSLIMEIAPSANALEGQQDLFEELFFQLLHNAWKFKEFSFGVYVQAMSRQNTVQIIFRDNGRGIMPALKDRVFEPFYQGPHEAGQYSGLGLGLAIVRRIVELHNGTIVCDGSEEQTSAFHIELPMASSSETDGS